MILSIMGQTTFDRTHLCLILALRLPWCLETAIRIHSDATVFQAWLRVNLKHLITIGSAISQPQT